jgi:hypothetical protein
MVFVADDLGAWLVALFVGAGRKELTSLVLGTQQERVLRVETARWKVWEACWTFFSALNCTITLLCPWSVWPTFSAADRPLAV